MRPSRHDTAQSQRIVRLGSGRRLAQDRRGDPVHGPGGVAVSPPAAVRRLPAGPGVYRFLDAAGEVLYLGRAADLRRRVPSSWSDLRDRRHLVPMVARVARVEAVGCDSEHEAAWLERNLLERRLPPWNLTPGGQEAPVHIQLDDSGPVPRLSVVHEPDDRPGRRGFGPYLGGSRTRLAVSALRRVFPLDYAGPRLTGTARGLAEVRDVHPRDREGLVRGVTAVLERDEPAMAAFAADLIRRRDAAADAHAFERAARIQAELEAVPWVLAVQRVTVPGAGDHEVHAWAAGVLVSFEVRDGRVRGWTQRPCPRTGALPLLRRSAARWQPFADRAAELAARLSAAGGGET
jgi:excinuclease ABC subunit C